MNSDNDKSRCLFCGKPAKYKYPMLLIVSGLDKLIGGVEAHVCQDCFSTKEVEFKKKNRKSIIFISIICTVVAVLLIGGLIFEPRSLLLFAACSIGAIQAVIASSKTVSRNESILRLRSESPEKFMEMFGTLQNVIVPDKKTAFTIHDVIFDYEALKARVAKGEAVSRGDVSKEIPLTHPGCCLKRYSDLTLSGVTGEERNVIRDLMKSNNN